MLTIKVNGVLNQTKININIKDQHPKIYAIQGPSGIGKTTILNIIAGLKAINYSYIKADSNTHRRAHETRNELVCCLLLEKKKDYEQKISNH
ncbi:hypothetical protein AZ906_05195 [Staphylococcus epidermidis]|nr:ATP-binding cassette domain-containing protein [Staphylococcus epidermidis]RUN35160.1 hypothetical protein AZ906_05195 [Staphylococcus epidermidis]